LELLVHAYTAGRNGLARNSVWRWHAVTAYLKHVGKIEEQLAGGLYRNRVLTQLSDAEIEEHTEHTIHPNI
jgi:hypothetical protein